MRQTVCTTWGLFSAQELAGVDAEDSIDVARACREAFAIAIFERTNALEETVQMARRFSVEAIEALDIFPRSALRDCLQDLAAFVVTRAS